LGKIYENKTNTVEIQKHKKNKDRPKTQKKKHKNMQNTQIKSLTHTGPSERYDR